MFLNKKIKEARLEKKMTQKQLADELTNRGRKTSNTAIANWESGLNSPDIDTLQIICSILGKDGNYFFDFENNNTSSLLEKIDLTGFTNEEIELIKKYIEFVKSQRRGEN